MLSRFLSRSWWPRAAVAWGLGVWCGSALGAGPAPVSFRQEVMAVLSKAGCASGPCHGNRQGKGGFKLSLRGEDPEADYLTIVQDAGGRRLDRQSPGESLLLLKPTGQVPHEGRVRFETNSVEYAHLRRWIEEGARDDSADRPSLAQLEVTPRERFLQSPERSLQITATARFADGSTRDVTRLAVYEPVNPLVEVTAGGEVRARQAGETTVLVRYLDRQEPVVLAFVPPRTPVPSERYPAPVNFIDAQVWAKLRPLRVAPAPRCGDATYVRRVFLDLCGVLPTAEEARWFVGEVREDKRERLVEALLERREFAEFWALKWADLLRLEERALDRKGAQLFHEWLVQRMADHTPLDRFVRELLVSRGASYAVPAVNWFRSHRTPVERSEAAAQVFLGTRLQCAQCHNHPYERWTQNDYHDWTAAFAGVQYKVLENRRRDENDSHEFIGEQIVFASGAGEHRNPRTGRPSPPRFLGAAEALPAGTADPLVPLADWLVQPENPLFARAQANRVWFHLMGRGLVEPLDDFRSTNPATHPALLEALARELVRARFDLRHLIRVILASHTYQAAGEAATGAEEEGANYAYAVPRRLTAEQLLDALAAATGVSLELAGHPPGTRAAQVAAEVVRRRRRGGDAAGADPDVFLQAFGKPPRQLTTECERGNEPAMNQVFQMIGGPMVQEMVTRPDNCLATWVGSGGEPMEFLEALFWRVLSRAPSPAERDALGAHLRRAQAAADRRAAAEDVLWSLLNAKEFILRH